MASSRLAGKALFYERCADQFLGGVGTRPEWAVGGVDLPTILETSFLKKSMNARRIDAQWRDLIASSPGKGPIASDLYFHVPFCPTLCGFCPFYTSSSHDEDRVQFYADRLIAQLDFFLPVLSRLGIENLYVGGGSPSVLSCGQIEAVFTKLFAGVKFDPRSFQATYECDPLTISREKLALIRSLGFNRISMGVQTLSRKTLHKMGRGYQEFERLKVIASWVSELGFPMFNLDLILGLHGEDSETFFESFKGVASLRPTDITVNLLRPIRKYVQTYYKADSTRCASEVEREVEKIEGRIGAAAGRAGYSWVQESRGGNAWFFARKGHRNIGAYDDRVGRNIFGIGSASRSTIHGRVAYEDRAALDKKFDPEADVFRIAPQDQEMAMAAYVLRKLKSPGWVAESLFKKRFGREFDEAFASAVAELSGQGELERQRGRWRLRATGSRRRLIFSLYFIGQERLRRFLDGWERIVTKIELAIGGQSVEFRLEKVRPGQKYAVTVEEIGLQVNVAGGLAFPAQGQALLKFLEAALSKEAGGFRELSAQEIARHLHGRLESLAAAGSPLMRKIDLKPLSIVAVDSDGAGIG